MVIDPVHDEVANFLLYSEKIIKKLNSNSVEDIVEKIDEINKQERYNYLFAKNLQDLKLLKKLMDISLTEEKHKKRYIIIFNENEKEFKLLLGDWIGILDIENKKPKIRMAKLRN